MDRGARKALRRNKKIQGIFFFFKNLILQIVPLAGHRGPLFKTPRCVLLLLQKKRLILIKLEKPITERGKKDKKDKKKTYNNRNQSAQT